MNEYNEEMSRKKQAEEDDFDETEDDSEIQKSKKSEEKVVTRKPAQEKEVKVVEDFNLLDVPKNVNLKSLIEDFIIPMIPEGYEIQFKPKKSSFPNVQTYTDRYAINDVIYETKQARPLFLNCKTKKVFFEG